MPITIDIPSREMFNEKTEEFITIEGVRLKLEHSLVSISKWEQIWKKPFISNTDKTLEETISYVKCMTLTQNVPESAYKGLTRDNIQKINDYISDPMTATWFSEEAKNKKGNSRIVTSELIYCWMIMLNIPVEFEKWHFNRLITLIQVCNEENKAPNKKLSKREIMNRNKSINAARRAAMHSRG